MTAPIAAPLNTGHFTIRKLTSEERDRYSLMRTLASTKVPYFAPALFALKPVAAPGLGTFASDDKGRVYLDFEGTKDWSVRESTGALIHEVLHVLRHHGRRLDSYRQNVGNLSHRQWNIAADLEINDDILSLDGVEMPPNILLPKMFGLPDENVAEWYAKNMQNKKEDCGSGSGDGKEDGDDPTPSNFCPGVGAMGDGNSADTVEKGLTDMQVDVVAQNTARSIQEHVKREQSKQSGRGRGVVPAGMQRWANEVLAPPKIDWRQQLRSHLRGKISTWKSRSTYSWKKVGRRAENHEIMPGRKGFLPSVKLAIDTSGSMRSEDFLRVLSEVQGICSGAGIKGKALSAFCVDAAIYEEQTVASAMDIVLKGGGGTDMRLAFDYVTAEPSRKPNILIVATDGFTPWPEEPIHGMDAIALLTNRSSADEVPSWITTIVVED